MDNRNLPAPVECCFCPPQNAGLEMKKNMHNQLWKQSGQSDRTWEYFDEFPYFGHRTTPPPYLAVCIARVWDGNLCDRAVCPHRGVFIHRLTRVIHKSGFPILFGQPHIWCVVNGYGMEDGIGSPGISSWSGCHRKITCNDQNPGDPPNFPASVQMTFHGFLPNEHMRLSKLLHFPGNCSIRFYDQDSNITKVVVKR